MILRALYQAARTEGASGETARKLLDLAHWFTVNAEFDPKTGQALPQALSAFLAKLAEFDPNGRTQDRLYRITEHARPALERLFRSLNESPRREQAILPVRAVREMDTGSFIKLSTRPGRNIREKLAGKPYLQAVRRFQSVNLPENRLLKAFASRLAELLKMRCDVLGEPEDELLPRIESWLFSDDARAIGNWNNLPPNNTLLAHRDYRRVWDSWRRLQSLDDEIAEDLSRLDARRDTMKLWLEYARMYREGTHLFADMPVLFDYETFNIRTWCPEPLFRRAARRVGRSTDKSAIDQAVCVDLAEVHPRYANSKSCSQVLTESYIWQQWLNDDANVDIALFKSDASYLHADAITIASPALFFATEGTEAYRKCLDRAARAFAGRLRETFKNDNLIWLVPDALNDFEMEAVRRNLNARFPGAEPLPRSIAALFEQIDYARITNDGYPVIVVDTVGRITCATKMIARFDADLKNRLPATNGYYWERCPPVMLSKNDDGEDRRYEMVTVDGNGQWLDSTRPEERRPIDFVALKRDKRIGAFAFGINVIHSPVAGGIRLHDLQAKAGDIPLWRDLLPELSIEVRSGGAVTELKLVSRQGRVAAIPRRGAKTKIPLTQNAILRAGSHEYRFPLVQGEGKSRLEYDAFLRSPAFPLTETTECLLELTYEYGADDPYELRFISPKNIFLPILTAWRPVSDRPPLDLNALPIPPFPPAMGWDEYSNFRTLKGNYIDIIRSLLGFVPYLDNIHAYLSYTAGDASTNISTRLCGTITNVQEDVVDGKTSFNGTISDYMGNSYKFRWGPYWAKEGVDVNFEVKQKGRYRYADKIYRGRELPDTYANRIESELALHLRRLTTRHSFNDSDCPASIRSTAMTIGDTLFRILILSSTTKKMRSSILFALGCLGDCCPNDAGTILANEAKKNPLAFTKHLSYAIGRGTTKWQRELLDITISNLGGHQCKQLLSSLSVAVWHADIVCVLSHSQVAAIIAAQESCIPLAYDAVKTSHNEQDRIISKRLLGQYLELMLGMLRSRTSAELKTKSLLSPESDFGERLVTILDNMTTYFIEHCEELRSRVELRYDKPPDAAAVPDLIYALRMFLTGDDGANAIHITGITDADDD